MLKKFSLEGRSLKESAEKHGVSVMTIRNWSANPNVFTLDAEDGELVVMLLGDAVQKPRKERAQNGQVPDRSG